MLPNRHNSRPEYRLSSVKTLGDFSAIPLGGIEPVSLHPFVGDVVLVVNTASHCGMRRQFHALESLYRDWHPQGLEILGFPCNQFLGQEPLSGAALAAHCQTLYGIDFPMFEKVKVNGPHTDPLFQWLRSQKRGIGLTSRLRWNFTKFLISRSGQVLARYAPTTWPHRLVPDIRRALAERPPFDLDKRPPKPTFGFNPDLCPVDPNLFSGGGLLSTPALHPPTPAEPGSSAK